ncbi:hypothetical protein FH972_006894 [Carpinus fangiana]|uniref:HMA domain-containing protein n=1 Tax=Carpinus fangiana TaxID=176857 RepID=A0A5N6QTW7_9ROSI|nr:hypothetical protein FH972_006894 [Carpinus fangiana]
MVSHFLRIAGVDKVEADAAKGTLTVTGDADPYEIIVHIRKAGKCAEVVSIGPPPAPPKKPDEKEPDKKKPDHPKIKVQIPCMPHNCLFVCEPVAMVPVGLWDEPNPPCSIM